MITTSEATLNKNDRFFSGHLTVVCDGDEDSERLYMLIEELFNKALANACIALKGTP